MTKLMNNSLNTSAKSIVDTSILEQAGPSQTLQAAKLNLDKLNPSPEEELTMQLDASLNQNIHRTKIIELLQTERDQMATQMERMDGICEWL